MLSYQHIYHAGNMADVHKHALLAAMLDYMLQKPKPITYFETHAGRGIYDLGSDEALKTGEAAAGIDIARDWFADDHPYARVIDDVRDGFGPRAYPGSPLIAALALRPGDVMNLAELHPGEFDVLEDNLIQYGARIWNDDGLAMVNALTPPNPRRGLMLIDPSYEIKTDYDAMSDLVLRIHRKWNVGVIALWYPILTSNSHRAMVNALLAADLPNVLHHEVRFGPARENHRMVGSGMFIVNAPYGLTETAALLDRHFA